MREKKKICLILLYDESEIQTSRVSEKDIHGIQHVCIRVFCVHLFAQCAEARARVGRLAARLERERICRKILLTYHRMLGMLMHNDDRPRSPVSDRVIL